MVTVISFWVNRKSASPACSPPQMIRMAYMTSWIPNRGRVPTRKVDTANVLLGDGLISQPEAGISDITTCYSLS